DYDVRFVYAHPADWYVSIFPGRDVIEIPIDEVLDINGWDIRKALGLLLKPNPVMLEWLSSPIRYIWDDAICGQLTEFSHRVAHRNACLHHYLHLAESQWTRHVGDNDEVNFKKYFYILRPALAIRWIRLRPDVSPPMNLQAMVAGLDLPDATIGEIARLLESKSKAKEIGAGKRIPAIDALIAEETAWARETDKSRQRSDLIGVADELFRRIVGEVDDV
ncbi:MAG: nucleotidyltransferase domain-containing protein, partial [Rhizobiales bacterium]|nr:nucleotidyltransferase domain-containing protein [Hyphomicrobiales bacterium]